MKDDSLRDLIERVEAYDPKLSRDNLADEMPLDLEIAKAVGIAGPDWQVARGSVTGYFSGDGVGGFGNPKVLPYTRSIDAAMTLVPEGWRFGIEQAGAYDGSPRDEAWCWPYESNFDPDWQNGQQGYRDASDGARGYASTPALALVAASLRAHMGTGG